MQTEGPTAKQPSTAALVPARPVAGAAACSPNGGSTAVASLQAKFDALAVGTAAGEEPAEQLADSTKGKGSPARLPVRRHATLLCLDDRLQALPWETLPGLCLAR